MKLVYSGEKRTTQVNTIEGVPIITYDILNRYGVKHGFSTRLGGVSEGIYSSMNLTYARGDNPIAVTENFRRICKAMEMDYTRLVFSDQIHEDSIYIVEEKDAGKGIARESDILNTDGLITNKKNIPLVTFYADCVPLYLYDFGQQVIASVHSGWRGTVLQIGRKAVEIMSSQFGSKVDDIVVAIGPSICQKCYEVDREVIDRFKQSFGQKEMEEIAYINENGKYQLNLWKANQLSLIQGGINEKNIAMPDLCTCCNSDYLFSHRATQGKRGNLAAFISL